MTRPGAAPREPLSPELRFFHVSPDGCGEERIVQLFRLNRHPSACHEGGRLADDIAYSAAAGVRPLAGWPGARAFTGLHRLARLDRAPVEGWRLFSHLDRHFPQAVFILARREPEAWIADRLTRQGGIVARAYARHLDCGLADLPEIWAAGWQRHLDAVTAHFDGDPRLVQVDLDAETPADLAARLAPWIDLPAIPAGPAGTSWGPRPDPRQGASLMRILDDGDRGAAVGEDEPDPAFVSDVASFCLRGLAPGDGGLDGVSPLYGCWDGAGGITRRDGSAWPVALGDDFTDPPGPRAFAAPGIPKLERLEGVVNDILSLGRRDPVHVDMEDNRWFGAPEGAAIGPPVLCHNRRQGARNAVLWPLPGYHVTGLPGFATRRTPDPVRWDDKIDRLVWRGNLSGGVQRPGRQRPVEAAHSVLARLARAGDDRIARERVRPDLFAIPRLDVVRRFAGNPDLDIGLVMAPAYRAFGEDPFLAPHVRPRLSPAQMHAYRYQLSLAGYDHPTNFIGAINSRSVLLKEDDGWEVYYLGRFQPWVHYIPVARHGADIPDKLAWARANPAACRAMSRAARAQVALLADRRAQGQIMARILDGIAAAR